jgi:CRP-like cAMP-binding protein
VTKQASSTVEFEREYSDHELICQEGESSNAMFIIQSGKVRIFKKARHGPVDLALLEKGNFWGK